MKQEPTCDLFDKYGDLARVAAPIFRDFGGRKRFSGEVMTVKCFEDNSRVKELANRPGRGKVLAIDGGGSLRCALIGDIIAKEAIANGWEGFVIFGCIRDWAILSELDIGVKALGAIPRKPAKNGEGQVGIEIDLGGLRCVQGDMLFADEDGVLVIESRHLADAVE